MILYLAAHRRPAARRGLTLIELVVVMAILAALAGILIPTLSGMLNRAHSSSSATNISEVAKLIQTYHTQYLGYPDNFDSLVTSTTGTQATYLLPQDVTASPDFTSVTLDDDLTESLHHAGIKNVTQMVEKAANTTTGNYRWNPTFYPYAAPIAPQTTPATTPIAEGSVFLGLNGAAAAREFSAPATATYVMFGIGKYSTLSRSMLDAPVHFGSEADSAPQMVYSRYLVVFQLTDADNVPLENAKMVGIGALHHGSVSSVGSHLNEYFAAD